MNFVTKNNKLLINCHEFLTLLIIFPTLNINIDICYICVDEVCEPFWQENAISRTHEKLGSNIKLKKKLFLHGEIFIV